ncbi:MAG: hypothetical protein JWR34_2882 [Mycobacterium sp.]|nr:hypothetical protein [Mycobacterium sp.]
MSSPPPPGPYGPPPQGGGAPSWGGQPAGYGGQYGLPPQGPTGGPPQWGQQPQWSGPPGPPPSKGGRGKWILGGLAVLVVVALAVVITVLVMRPSGGGPTPTPTNGNSGFASANDTGPVNIIAEDPTCAAWGKVASEYADATAAVNWGKRDQSVAASSWTPEQRTMYDAVGKALTRAADQTKNLVKQTPHRVMRELYEQFIAYGRAFVAKIPSYVADDGNMAVVTDTITTATANVCSAIDYRSAPAIAPLIPDPAAPSEITSPSDPDSPSKFLPASNAICTEWESTGQKFSDDTEEWRSLDPKIPATEWTPEQKAVNDAVAPMMADNAKELERLGRQSHNAILEDFAVLAAQYRRAFVAAIPNYTSADDFLSGTAAELVRAVTWACKAAG